MRAHSLLSQWLMGLITHDKAGHGVSLLFDRGSHLPSPAVEIVYSKNVHPYRSSGENTDLQGANLFKGGVSVADVIGFSSLETVSSKIDGYLKKLESSVDLVNVLKHEIRDGQLSFRGKRVLELNCGYGLPGIFACLKGASTVHFQDLNAEAIRRTTIPNVLSNLEQACNSGHQLAPDVHFYAGNWAELSSVLSVVQPSDGCDLTAGMSFSFSEEDFSSLDGTAEHETLRKSRKLSRSRAWERASESDQRDGGYDAILIAEIPSYSVCSLKKLCKLITKCLRPPYGVLYLAAKKNFIGSNGGAKQLRSLMEEEGLFGSYLLSELADREIWKFFLK